MSEDIRLVSGHYWPCVRDGHPRDCPECSERYLRDAAEHA